MKSISHLHVPFLFVTPVMSAAILARSRHPRAVTTVRGSDGDGTGRVASWLSPGFCRGGTCGFKV